MKTDKEILLFYDGKPPRKGQVVTVEDEGRTFQAEVTYVPRGNNLCHARVL